MLGGASTRILSALSALPRRLPLPGLVPIGRQVSLPRLAAAPTGTAGQQANPAATSGHNRHHRQRRRAHTTTSGAPAQHDPLAPTSVSGRLANHRMIAYRLRICSLVAAATAGVATATA